MYDTSYLNMQHLGAVNKQFMIVVFPDHTDLLFSITETVYILPDSVSSCNSKLER